MNTEKAKAQTKALELIHEKGLCAAYAGICNDIFDHTARWPQDVDQEKLRFDELVRDEIAQRLAVNTLENNGWYLDHTYYHDWEWKKGE